MRTIKFRGKDVETGKWIYGYLGDGNLICDWNNNNRHSFEVKATTVGEFTGLTDKNGNKIYEGDIIKIDDEGVVLKPKVVDFLSGKFCAGEWTLTYYGEDNIEVIGNIHDNPELLKNND